MKHLFHFNLRKRALPLVSNGPCYYIQSTSQDTWVLVGPPSSCVALGKSLSYPKSHWSTVKQEGISFTDLHILLPSQHPALWERTTAATGPSVRSVEKKRDSSWYRILPYESIVLFTILLKTLKYFLLRGRSFSSWHIWKTQVSQFKVHVLSRTCRLGQGFLWNLISGKNGKNTFLISTLSGQGLNYLFIIYF